jgi:hypothetical protein
MSTINLIRNCTVKFRKVCPQRWEHLAPATTEGVRFCTTCRREVFWCETDVEAVAHAQAGHCIAKPAPDLSGSPRTAFLGRPRITASKPTREERLLGEEAAREDAKTRALRDIEYASRTCPRCGYPYADWLKACGVCGRRTGRRVRPPAAG